MEQISRLLILIQIISILVISPSTRAADYEDSSSVTMEMMHRHSLPGAPESNADRLWDLVKNDEARQNMIAQQQHRRMQQVGGGGGDVPSVEMKMFPGADWGHATYFVDFNIGSPFQRFAIVVDTGSDLTWIRCKAKCSQNCTWGPDGKIGGKRYLIGNRSSSFKPVPCSSKIMCIEDWLPANYTDACPTPNTTCPYFYEYSQGMSAGFLVTEEVVLFTANRTEKMRLSNVLIGCSQESDELNFSDGILGLGYANQSFPMNTVAKFGGKFSYCLVDHMDHRTAVNYLVFGSKRSRGSILYKNQNFRYTSIDVESCKPFYAVQVIGFSLDMQFMMEIPAEAWDVNKPGGGVIIDSGMSLTQLTTSVYRPVVNAFEKALAKYPRVEIPEVPMKFCFNSTGLDLTTAPKFRVHFRDKARFEPHVKSYIIDVAPGVSCLGFAEKTSKGDLSVVIGNILQQNHLWEFDLIGKRLGFGPSLCTD